MGLDIRLPIGLMFSIVGAMLVIYGWATGGNTELYKRSLGINVDLRWGLFLLVFGLWMLWMALRALKKSATTPPGESQGETGTDAGSPHRDS